MIIKLQSIFTEAKILSYAQACIDIATKIMDLENENYQNIIIPSRGAYPFYNYCIKIYSNLTNNFNEFHEFNVRHQAWLLPFTADWGGGTGDITSESARKFWAKILNDYLNKLITPHTKFYSYLVNHLGKRYTLNTSNLLPPKRFFVDNESKNIIFIDTAVSGRAISEIIKAFHDYNITTYKIILIADDSGNALKQPYRDIIQTEINNDKLYLFKVEDIFSEDTTPLFNTGICSVVFPNLMLTALNRVSALKTDNFVGAGLWFVDAVSHLRDTSLNGIRGALNDIIVKGINKLMGKSEPFFADFIHHSSQIINEEAGETNIFDPQTTLNIVTNRIMSRSTLTDQLTVSGSHVVRINLNESYLAEVIKSLNYRL